MDQQSHHSFFGFLISTQTFMDDTLLWVPHMPKASTNTSAVNGWNKVKKGHVFRCLRFHRNGLSALDTIQIV